MQTKTYLSIAKKFSISPDELTSHLEKLDAKEMLQLISTLTAMVEEKI